MKTIDVDALTALIKQLELYQDLLEVNSKSLSYYETTYVEAVDHDDYSQKSVSCEIEDIQHEIEDIRKLASRDQEELEKIRKDLIDIYGDVKT